MSGAVEIQQVPREESVISATPERNPGNHNRKYQKTWKEEFPWIEYDASKDVATCSVCKRAVQNNALPAKSITNSQKYHGFPVTMPGTAAKKQLENMTRAPVTMKAYLRKIAQQKTTARKYF